LVGFEIMVQKREKSGGQKDSEDFQANAQNYNRWKK
jgi:hypothetical protein